MKFHCKRGHFASFLKKEIWYYTAIMYGRLAVSRSYVCWLFIFLCVLGRHLECRPLDPTLDISSTFMKKSISLLFSVSFQLSIQLSVWKSIQGSLYGCHLVIHIVICMVIGVWWSNFISAKLFQLFNWYFEGQEFVLLLLLLDAIF